jgi:hypothetical protein
MMKTPTMGQIVLFHFHDRERKALITRPAVVVVPPDDSGVSCGLYVMWWPTDSPQRGHRDIGTMFVDFYLPAVAATTAAGRIPADYTWTFRPEDL